MASNTLNKWKNWKVMCDFLSFFFFYVCYHYLWSGTDNLDLCFPYDLIASRTMFSAGYNAIWYGLYFFICSPLRHWRLTPFLKDKGFCLFSRYGSSKLARTLRARLVSSYRLKIFSTCTALVYVEMKPAAISSQRTRPALCPFFPLICW